LAKGQAFQKNAALFAFLLGTSSADADRIVLPDLGDASESALSVSKEREIGNQIMQEIRQHHVIVDDLISQEYMSSLGHQLVSQADTAVHDFHFFIINEKGINAFALPGGYIGVNAGLILATEDESELAAVVAHEISHVTQRHLARAFFHAETIQGPVIAAMIAAILIGGEAGQAAIAAASAGSVQSQINFTRKNEQEADRVGIGLLARAGFDADSMATLFEKMHKQARLYGGAPPEFLSTHPVHGSRIADARARAQSYPAKPQPNSVAYRVVRARLQVLLSGNPTKVASDLKRRLEEGQTADQVMDRYALAFALLQSGQIAEADQQSKRLLEVDPDIMAFQLLRAEVDLARGKDRQALDRLQQLRLRHPDDHVLTLEYARMLIEVGQAADARHTLEDYLIYRQGDPRVYRILSHACKASGDTAKSHDYMAEHHQLQGDIKQAIAHLEAALQSPISDYYQEARLQAKLKALRGRQSEDKKSGK